MNPALLDIEKNQRLKIPKNLDVDECWGLIKPVVASEIGNDVYTPVPYLTETSVYKISNVFIRDNSVIGCYGAMKKGYKVIGALNKFINKSYTSPDWCVPQLPTIKTTPDFLEFKVRIGSGDNEIIFHGCDYRQLRISELMRPVENLQLNRNSHEDLDSVDRFGLINCVAEAKNFEINVTTKTSSRILYVGEKHHTILFGYQICHIDRTGVVISVSNGRPSKTRFVSLRPKTRNVLPLWQPEG